MNAIETIGLTKYYGRERGIIDLNFVLEEGETYGFIGPNGAGKTTTIRLLLSLLFPSRGTGKVFGLDIVKDGPAIKRMTGFVPSEVHYYDQMTVKELLNYSVRFYGIQFEKEHFQLIDAFDLDINRKIEDLSMGNRKKVAIIQGLLHRPRLLILDEPTSGLDPLMKKRFFEILKAKNKQGTTIFFSSHILAEVQKFCHRVAIIKDGKIVDEEDMVSIGRKSLNRVTYHLKGGSEARKPNLKGIISYEQDEYSISFLYKGEISLLLKELSKTSIEKLTITEPDLEEVFIHYYQEEKFKDNTV